MRMAGNSLRTRDHSRSAAAAQMFIGCSVIITSIGASGAVTASWPDEPRWIDSTTSVVAQRLSTAGPSDRVVEARVAERRRVLGEGERVHALRGEAAHLGGRQLGVPQHGQAHRDEAAGVRRRTTRRRASRCRPAARRGRGPCRRRAANSRPREAGERREAHRAEHAAGVHVLDALVDVAAAGPHLVEGGRLDAVLLLGPAGDGVEPDVGDHRAR